MGTTLATGAGLTAFCGSLPPGAAAAYPDCAGQVQPNVGPVSIGEDLSLNVPGPGIGNGPGQCPMLPAGNCTDLAAPSANPVDCSIYRECDPYTGAQHPGYVTGGQGNPYSWAQDGSGNWIWYGGDGNPATPPNWATPPSSTPIVTTRGEYNPATVGKLQSISAPGMTYNPSSGWTPAAGSAPTDTSPSIPAFVNTPGNASAGPSAAPGGLAAVFGNPGGPSTAAASTGASGLTAAFGSGDVGKKTAASVAAAAPPAGSPGTSGTIAAVTAKPKSSGLLLIGAVILFVILANK